MLIRSSAMVPSIRSTAVVRFADGEFVVPRWWTTLALFRQAPEYGDAAPALAMTLAEARMKVNAELERTAISGLMRDWIAEHRAAQ